ncbi:MAG: type II secretion system F family protein [Streptosporangiaceae bacterium]
MSSSVLLAVGVGAIALAIIAVAVSFMPKRAEQPSISRALATIEERYSRDPASAKKDPFKLPAWLERLAARLSPAGVATVMQRRLDIAGNPGGWTTDRMLAVKGLGLVAIGVLGALVGLRSPELLVLGAGVGAALGFFLPDILLHNSGLRRQQQIPRALPDALDMLTICVEAGLGFDAALAQVARHTPGPLAGEFARVLQEMQIGKSRSQAMRAMGERTTVPELRAFVSAMVQSSELGIPVAHVLREQAKEMRVRRRQRAEAQAQKVPVKITFPLIMCLFPALLVIVIGPGIIQIAHSLFGK